MGAVWLAATAEGRHCAIKILTRTSERRGSAERSFNREVRAMARLSHVGVAQIYDYGRTPEGAPFVAMEYVAGGSLHAYMRGEWSSGALWNLIDGLLSALGHAHARDLIHRDLKPGNILLSPDTVGPGGVKLVDFGIALAVNEADSAGRRIEGTPAYIAPEAASGNVAATGPWTDLYSLGVILYEILSGAPPFRGRHLLSHHQHSPLPPIIIREDVKAPNGLVPIIERLLEKSTTRRFRSVAALKSTLAPLFTEPPQPFGAPPSLLGWADDESMTGDETLLGLTTPTGPTLIHLREPCLVGRVEAQATLARLASEVLDGRGPKVVLIEGEAGFGKRRLAGWLRERVEEAGTMRTLVARSEPQTTGRGLRQAILRFIGAPTATRDQGAAVLAEAFSDEGVRRNAFEALWGAAGEGSVTEQGLKQMAALIADLAEGAPFLLLAEDAQWSPEGRILRLAHRLARCRNPHLLVLITLRPNSRTTVAAARRALLALENAHLIELGPISPMVLAPALEALAALPPGLSEAAAIQAAGNPLLALESIRGYLEAEGLGWAPIDPRSALQERIIALAVEPQGRALRDLIARATLLGRSFTLRPLTELCVVAEEGPAEAALPIDPEAVEVLLERAVSAGFIKEQGPKRWQFAHDLARAQFKEIAQASPAWRALNLRAAVIKERGLRDDPTGIEQEVVARHLWEAGEQSRALRLGFESAMRLHASGLMGHATSFIRKILDWDDRTQLLSAEERGDLRLLGATAAEHAGQPLEAERHTVAAIELARRNYLPALGARAASQLGVLKIQQEHPEEAERWLWESLRFARESNDQRALSNAYRFVGQYYQHQGKLDLARLGYDSSLEYARAGGLKLEEINARQAIATLDRADGHLQRAIEALSALIIDADVGGFEVAVHTARLQLGLSAWLQEDPDAALSAFKEVQQGARGNLFALEFVACLGQAWAYAAKGRWHNAELMLLQAEDLRYDVHIQDPEAEQLRLSLKSLARAARRSDIARRVEALGRVGSTHGSRSG